MWYLILFAAVMSCGAIIGYETGRDEETTMQSIGRAIETCQHHGGLKATVRQGSVVICNNGNKVNLK